MEIKVVPVYIKKGIGMLSTKNTTFFHVEKSEIISNKEIPLSFLFVEQWRLNLLLLHINIQETIQERYIYLN